MCRTANVPTESAQLRPTLVTVTAICAESRSVRDGLEHEELHREVGALALGAQEGRDLESERTLFEAGRWYEVRTARQIWQDSMQNLSVRPEVVSWVRGPVRALRENGRGVRRNSAGAQSYGPPALVPKVNAATSAAASSSSK